MQRAQVIGFVVALAGTAVSAHTALAWSEQENDPPFTAHVAQQRGFEAASSVVKTDVHGEAKNQLPFTRSVAP